MTAAQPVLERAYRWAGCQSDRLNAIVIRETRRALYGKLFMLSFLILLALCTFMSMAAVFGASHEQGIGRDIFGMLFMSLCGVAFFGLPLMLSTLVHTEIREKTFEMLSITTLTPARIVWGELMTALGLFVLMASAVAPFMAFSYLLGGVDLRVILTGVGYAFLVSMGLTLVALVAALQGTTESVTRIGVAILSLMIFSSSFQLVLGFRTSVLQSMWDDPDVLLHLSIFLGVYLSIGAIFFAAAVGRLSPAATNRSGPVRLAVAAHIVVAGAGMAYIGEPEAMQGWALYAMCVLFLMGVVVIGEDEALSRRQRRGSRLRSFVPLLWTLFLPGARRGLAFVFLMGLLTAGIACIFGNLVTTRSYRPVMPQETRDIALVGCSYLIFYLSAAYGLSRLMPRLLQKPMAKRVALLVVFVITLFVPLLVALTTQQDVDDMKAMMAFNPLFYYPVMMGRWNNFETLRPISLLIQGIGVIVLVVMFRPIGKAVREGIAVLKPPTEPS